MVAGKNGDSQEQFLSSHSNTPCSAAANGREQSHWYQQLAVAQASRASTTPPAVTTLMHPLPGGYISLTATTLMCHGQSGRPELRCLHPYCQSWVYATFPIFHHQGRETLIKDHTHGWIENNTLCSQLKRFWQQQTFFVGGGGFAYRKTHTHTHQLQAHTKTICSVMSWNKNKLEEDNISVMMIFLACQFSVSVHLTLCYVLWI